ncbi:retrovirus-related Pol polyprotein from transposon RE1 [Trichonephila clavipes]|nr:retrovirus-related Pol polyprotein from transposon RE1 [Trichonephila clavipes]
MDNFLTELGIKHEVTNSYTPEMNGVAERFNLTALDGIKTLLKSSEVPHKFWGEALLFHFMRGIEFATKDDSDFATNRDDRVSMGGFITFIDETPISWRTFKQKSVSLSTMEAEYVSLTEAAKEYIWLKNEIPKYTTYRDDGQHQTIPSEGPAIFAKISLNHHRHSKPPLGAVAKWHVNYGVPVPK